MTAQAGLLIRGSMLVSAFPSNTSSGLMENELAAYSCGFAKAQRTPNSPT